MNLSKGQMDMEGMTLRKGMFQYWKGNFKPGTQTRVHKTILTATPVGLLQKAKKAFKKAYVIAGAVHCTGWMLLLMCKK